MKNLESETFPLAGHQLIEASAGTGKTYTITNLYLRLLLGQRTAGQRTAGQREASQTEPGQNETPQTINKPLACSEILVLTFTIAATAELRQRIRDRIAAAKAAFTANNEADLVAGIESRLIQNEPDTATGMAAGIATINDPFLAHLVANSNDITRDRKLLGAALQTMDEASIYTIHGFCARVLNEQSFETGSLFSQSMEADRDQLLKQATEDCFRTHILGLKGYEKHLALELWPTPTALEQKTKAFLFRHKLIMQPPHKDVGDEIKVLFNDIQRCKKIWLAEDIVKVVRDCGFHGGRKTIKRLDAMQDYCLNSLSRTTTNADLKTDHSYTDALDMNALDVERWQPWSEQGLKNATSKKTVQPQHSIFKLIESIYQRRGLIGQVKYNLWQQMIANLRQNLASYKHQLGQFTLDDLLIDLHTALSTTDILLADHLRKKWPVAMIDEFQDTDDIQFEIFSKIYPDKSQHALFYIGDPKQAIYQFRGADIYTYINAKRQIDDKIYSLATNWRSTLGLVDAVNQLFHQPNIFGDDKDIPFTPANSFEALDAANTKEKPGKQLVLNGQAVKPVALAYIDGEDLLKHQTRNLSIEHAAERCAELLIQAESNNACIGGQPIKAGQIAFLVRSRLDAKAARQALAKRNINSVYVTLDSVMTSDTAVDLLLILQAVLAPNNEAGVKAAVASQLMLGTVSEIDAISRDSDRHQAVTEEFQHYQSIWQSLNIAAMIEQLIINRKLAHQWLNQQDGERQITNLRHLAEILQTRTSTSFGMYRLIKWFSREIQAAQVLSQDDRQLRLESDQDLVQIVTIHASKGLEYDIVMIPMAGFSARPVNKNEPLLVHEELVRQEPALENGAQSAAATQASDSEQNNSSLFQTVLNFTEDSALADKVFEERLAEDMRLLYVAITRAKYHCHLGITLSKNLPKTALGQLLQMPQSKNPADLIEALMQLPKELFNAYSLQNTPHSIYQQQQQTSQLVAPAAKPRIKDHWRIHSYSSLTHLISRQVNKVNPQLTANEQITNNQTTDNRIQANTAPNQSMQLNASPGFFDDDLTPAATSQAITKQTLTTNAPPSRFTFPRGPQVGTLLHEMLEKLDFKADNNSLDDAVDKLLKIIPASVAIHTIDAQKIDDSKTASHKTDSHETEKETTQWPAILQQWLSEILTTPMFSNQETSADQAANQTTIQTAPNNFILQDIPATSRLNEMEFHFPAKVEQSFLHCMQTAGYLDDHSQLAIDRVNGMMTGFIDLVVEHEQKYYIIDYKSNHLGPSQGHYNPVALANDIKQHQYDLQYLIYTVALHRHLKRCQPAYTYATHFGGVCYLYLRGMCAQAGAGIHFDLPDESLINQLDQLLEPVS
ncbi:MAG: exodeoxyribonuclease V subunit beta [Pseudomonadales bacterium]|nr:exodeoxyribonuclease V subunit beta [Pseudomonadales bacterium]